MVAVVSVSHAVVVQPCRRSINSWSHSRRCVLCCGRWLLVKVLGQRWRVRWVVVALSPVCLESLAYLMVCQHSQANLQNPVVVRKLAKLLVKRSASRKPGVERGNACNCRTPSGFDCKKRKEYSYCY